MFFKMNDITKKTINSAKISIINECYVENNVLLIQMDSGDLYLEYETLELAVNDHLWLLKHLDATNVVTGL